MAVCPSSFRPLRASAHYGRREQCWCRGRVNAPYGNGRCSLQEHTDSDSNDAARAPCAALEPFHSEHTLKRRGGNSRCNGQAAYSQPPRLRRAWLPFWPLNAQTQSNLCPAKLERPSKACPGPCGRRVRPRPLICRAVGWLPLGRFSAHAASENEPAAMQTTGDWHAPVCPGLPKPELVCSGHFFLSAFARAEAFGRGPGGLLAWNCPGFRVGPGNLSGWRGLGFFRVPLAGCSGLFTCFG